MKNKTKVVWLKAPLIALMSASFIVSIYAAINKIEGAGWTASGVLGATLALYAWGAHIAE